MNTHTFFRRGTTARGRRLSVSLRRLFSLLLIVNLCSIQPFMSVSASSLDPTEFVNTEAFMTIDDTDIESNVMMKFGDTLAKTITYNRSTTRFEFSDAVSVAGDLHVAGTASGAALTFMNGNSYVLGNFGIGKSGTPNTRLEVAGSMSGVALTISSLRNCNSIDTNLNGVLACGTDETGGGSAGAWSNTGSLMGAFDNRYANLSGDTMTGALTIDLKNVTSGTGLILQEKAYFGSGATLSGSLILKARTDPPAAEANKLAIYTKNIAGRMMLKGVGPSGLDYPYQPSIFNSNIAMFYPATSTTAGQVTGWTFTSAGTVSHPTIASTNLQTSMRRTRWASATTSNAVGGIFTAQTNCWRGNATGLGGFFFFARFTQAVSTNGARAFVGLSASTAHMVAGEPSAAVNIIGVGYDAADVPGNWRLMHNDASGVATEVDLGSNAARNTSHVYDLFLFAPANGSSVTVRLVNQSTNTVVLDNYVISTDIPANTTFLRIHAGGGPAASAVAQNFELNRLYLETDF